MSTVAFKLSRKTLSFCIEFPDSRPILGECEYSSGNIAILASVLHARKINRVLVNSTPYPAELTTELAKFNGAELTVDTTKPTGRKLLRAWGKFHNIFRGDCPSFSFSAVSALLGFSRREGEILTPAQVECFALAELQLGRRLGNAVVVTSIIKLAQLI